VREDPVSLVVGYPKGVVSTSRIHRKSDSIVEAGRPATEGDWIEKDRGNTEGVVADKDIIALKSRCDIRIWHKGGVVLGFQVSIRGTRAGRAHLTIVNLFCQGSGWLEAVSSVAGESFQGSEVPVEVPNRHHWGSSAASFETPCSV